VARHTAKIIELVRLTKGLLPGTLGSGFDHSKVRTDTLEDPRAACGIFFGREHRREYGLRERRSSN
jgi:hypothetical protein